MIFTNVNTYLHTHFTKFSIFDINFIARIIYILLVLCTKMEMCSFTYFIKPSTCEKKVLLTTVCLEFATDVHPSPRITEAILRKHEKNNDYSSSLSF